MRVEPFSPLRAWLIAQNTLREAVRQKLLHSLLLLALAFVLGSRWLRGFDFGASELKFVADCGFGAMAFFGAALVVVAAAHAFFGEIESGTAQALLAKPVARAEFLGGKLLGVIAVAGIFCALLTGVLAAVLGLREAELMRALPGAFPRGRTVDYALIAWGGALQWLKLAVLGALTLLVASFARSQLFTIVTGFLVLVICHLQHLVHDAPVRGGSLFGRVGAGLAVNVFPNFQLFAPPDPFAGAEVFPWSHALRISAYGFLFVAAAGALAVFSFRRREL